MVVVDCLSDPAAAASKIEWLRLQLQHKAAHVSQLYARVGELERALAAERAATAELNAATAELNAASLSDLQHLQEMHAQQVTQLQLQLQAQDEAAQRAAREWGEEGRRRDRERQALEAEAERLRSEQAQARAALDAERSKVRACVRYSNVLRVSTV